SHAEEDNLLTVADKLGALITDFGISPPYQGDQRLSAIAQTAVWFAGFSLSLINSKTMLRESLVIFRLVDIEQQACTFHLAHLAWPEVMERSSAASYLAGMAKQLRRELLAP
ncbi:MAG: hypothetical protein OQL20_04165, partial [Sedimenticola sp.]|nr:hypothetical protein [Sedimenticola sp.]